MDKKILTAFPNCSTNTCLKKSNDKNIYVVDTDTKCEIIATIEENLCHFHAINHKNKDVFFLAIDKCIYTDSAHKKCDFALFDDKTFCFVEIKDTYKRKSGNKKSSVEQLRTTIEKFITEIEFTGYNLEAIISWRYRPLRPAVSTKMQSNKADFLLNLNTKLLEGNQKEFH